ncbi:MAG: hypothetical protein ACI857_000402 [Arenicella sp.]|jgi:hypothetical protein
MKELLKNWGLEFLILAWFFFVLYPFGPGTTFDSVSFLQAGDNLLNEGLYLHSGKNGLEFAAHRFPLYPIITSVLNLVPKGLILFQLLLFSGTILLFRRFLAELNAPKYFLLFFGLYFILTNYYCLWTEGLFGLLFIALLILIAKENRPNPIWPIAVLIGLLCLTRMVGLVSAGSLFLAYLLINRKPRAVLALMIGLLTIIAWTIIGSYYLGETARPFATHLPEFKDFVDLIESLGGLLTPAIHPVLAISLGAILFVLPALYLIKVWKDKVLMSLLDWFLIIHFYAYIIFLFLSLTFIDASIPFGLRTSFPLYLNLIALGVVSQTSVLMTDKWKSKMKYVLPKALILFFGISVFSSLTLRENGVGYNSKEWNDFAFTNQIEELGLRDVFTNDHGPIQYFSQFYTNTYLLPEKKNLYSQIENQTFREEMDVLIHDFPPNNLIIWIRNGITTDVYSNYDELKELEGFEVVYDDWLCLILKPK